MKLIYALEDFPAEITKSIFLAGPTPRDNSIESWRKEAIQILEKLGYDGTVFIPEPRNNQFTKDYDKQVDWETQMLNAADCIMFWIPRDLEKLPGFTTNVEWGVWENSGKVVIGFPKDSPKNTYLEYQAKKLQVPVTYDLESTIKNAMQIIGEGALRKDGECYVPFYIWKLNEFQDWYNSQKKVGNELRYAKLNYVFIMPKARKVFLWIMNAHVYVKDEDRVKDIEFILSRTNLCSAVLYKKGNTLEDTEVVLVKEFRTPVNNSEEKVYEIPGGSSTKEKDNIDVIHDEIKEELGIDIDKKRLEFIEGRQMMATLSAHKCYLYKLELSNEEMDQIKTQKGQVHGVVEDTEMTYTEVFTIKDILSNQLLDWSNLGMILSAIK